MALRHQRTLDALPDLPPQEQRRKRGSLRMKANNYGQQSLEGVQTTYPNRSRKQGETYREELPTVDQK